MVESKLVVLLGEYVLFTHSFRREGNGEFILKSSSCRKHFKKKAAKKPNVFFFFFAFYRFIVAFT